MSFGDENYVKRAIKKELGKRLIYKNEKERVEIEEKVFQLYDILVYMKENNLTCVVILCYYKDWRTGEIKKVYEYESKYFIGTCFTRLKIIDFSEVVYDVSYTNVLEDIKPLEYYDVGNTLKRELEKLWT